MAKRLTNVCALAPWRSPSIGVACHTGESVEHSLLVAPFSVPRWKGRREGCAHLCQAESNAAQATPDR